LMMLTVPEWVSVSQCLSNHPRSHIALIF